MYKKHETESQNGWCWKGSWDHFVHSLCSGWVTYRRLPRALSVWVLNICRDRDSIACSNVWPLSQLKSIFLCSGGFSYICFNLWPLPLVQHVVPTPPWGTSKAQIGAACDQMWFEFVQPPLKSHCSFFSSLLIFLSWLLLLGDQYQLVEPVGLTASHLLEMLWHHPRAPHP